MHFHKHVWRLHRNIDVQVDRIRNHARSPRVSVIDILLIERAIVQLQIEWEQFVRFFILDCATGRFNDRNGTVTSGLPSKPANRERASHLLVSLYRKRNKEPNWYRPTEAIDAADRLLLSNFCRISMTLGVTPWLLDDLRHLRNFIVHQSKRSAEEIRRNQIVTASNRIIPAQSALAFGIAGGQMFVGWANFMKTISRSLI